MRGSLQGAEIECVKMLAKLFEKGEDRWRFQDDPAAIGLTNENYEPVLATMELCGAIEDATHTSRIKYHFFRISPYAVQVARQIEDQDREAKEQSEREVDIVEQIQKKARSHPAFAWVLIVFVFLMAVATFINQTISILQSLGLIGKP